MTFETLMKTFAKALLPILLIAPFAVRSQVQALPGYPVEKNLAAYKKIRLNTDISHLSENEKKALVHLIRAAKVADRIFWKQCYGNKDSLLALVTDPALRSFIELNYGPWDRLNDNAPFVAGVGPKSDGVNFYPADMSKTEFDSFYHPEKNNQYSVVKRNAFGQLEVIEYNHEYEKDIEEMSQELLKAALAIGPLENESFFQYLMSRGQSLHMNTYQMSDVAWLNVKNANLDIIIGPIENYEDKLYGTRTAFEAYVLVRDKEWSKKLEKYIAYLPGLQENLPVDSIYKAEKPGSSGSQLAVFDVVYYAGDCNAGSKTIAVNLPNDEDLQKSVGTRRSQLKNAMQAKFDNIVVPISQMMITPGQQKLINFNGFFSNVMFHEVAHGLGIKNTINGKGTVREALGPDYSAIEECKADVLGLWMVTKMHEKKELQGSLDEYYVTFVASVFRSVRFGAASAHGKANMITFNTLLDDGAIVRDNKGYYTVNVPKMKLSIEKLAGTLLKLQGNGDAPSVRETLLLVAQIQPELAGDLKRINDAGVPVDIVFEQGEEVLGL